MKIDLFDQTGVFVANLKNGNYKIGHYAMDLILPESVSSGVYYLRVSNGINERAAKLTVIN